MTHANRNVRFTYEDYKSIPETAGRRYELLHGDMLRVPASTTSHQRALRNLGQLLVEHVRGHKAGEVLFSPIDVVLGEGIEREIVQPDIVFIGRDRQQLVFDEEIRGAPDLVVEILSPATRERDKGYKKMLYSRYSVREVWIIDPQAKTSEVYTAGGPGPG